MNYIDELHGVYPLLLAVALLSLVVAVVTDSINTFHAVGVILTAFGVVWYLEYDPETRF